jgi:hypothetical protein
MAWDEQGALHCGNEHLYQCPVMTERGSQASTDLIARRQGWKIWGDDANCPTCSKPGRNLRKPGELEQEMFPLDFGQPKEKKSRKTARQHS